MDHLLTCSCGVEHTVSKSQAGQEILCECGNPIAIPTLRGFADLPTAESAVPPSRDRTTIWQGWRGPCMAIFTGLFLIAAFMATWFFIQSKMFETNYTAETEIVAGEELFDLYGPSELSMVWNDYEIYGLGRKSRPGFYVWAKYAQERMVLCMIAGTVAGTFGCLAAGVWISARLKHQPRK